MKSIIEFLNNVEIIIQLNPKTKHILSFESLYMVKINYPIVLTSKINCISTSEYLEKIGVT